jgi:succinate-semialdehyde dehydrogenase / glutarate-semialdehyde dehydrogenase
MPFESINPATGERVATYRSTTAAEVDTILTETRRAQREWAETPFAERARCMRVAGTLLRERSKDLARIMALEMGKPLKDGVGEATKCAWVCEHYADHGEAYLAQRTETSDGSKAYVRFDPLGVILAVMPWNFPYWQAFRFIAPNLLAGNAGLLKHAPNVPQCALSIEALLHDAGFPRELFRNLFIEPEEVAKVIADDRVAGVTLTGSERAGRSVGEAAGKAMKAVVLELGGSDPFIVLADADLEVAAKTAVTARTINAGQSCIAAKRFIVEAPLYDRFLEAMTVAMRALKMGDPLDPSTEIGPQARRDLRDGLDSQVSAAINAGARVVLGCEVPTGPGWFYPPSILADVTTENPAAREELFGPVATVMRARDESDAIAIANATRFGLGASLWTKDIPRAEKLAARIEAGAVFVNGMVKSDPRLPFGGVKASGVGRELGLEGARAFTNAKTIWIR